jgi:hypothetical protein
MLNGSRRRVHGKKQKKDERRSILNLFITQAGMYIILRKEFQVISASPSRAVYFEPCAVLPNSSDLRPKNCYAMDKESGDEVGVGREKLRNGNER